MEEIDEATYIEMSSRVTPIQSLHHLEMDEVEIMDCDTGACPVR